MGAPRQALPQVPEALSNPMSGSPDRPDRPVPPMPGASRPPAPPPAGLLRRDESPLVDYMRQRVEMIERELIKERERATAAEGMLKQQEALRTEVEDQLRRISEQIKREKVTQDLEEEKTLSKGRIEALEQRLDDMHKTWARMIQDALSKGLGSSGAQKTSDEVRALFKWIKASHQEISGLKKAVASLRTVPPPEAPPAERAGPAPAELQQQLEGMVGRVGQVLVERLAAIDRRFSQELEDHNQRLSAVSRERESLRDLIDEQRHQARQEFIQERVALEGQLHTQLEELRKAVEALGGRQSGSADALAGVEELARQIHAILSRPAQAKDQMLQDLEAEKQELMTALRQRGEQLRAYTLERREVERSLGESLLDLNRQLEGERAKRLATEQEAASLRQAVSALDGRLELQRMGTEEAGQRTKSVAAERDATVCALAEEAAKVRRQIDERLLSDKRWEEKVLEVQKLLDEERRRRLDGESAISELRAQLQTLSENIGRALRGKEEAEGRFGQWGREREELLSTLRKKDEMIGMLSSTFQNLLKKPAA